MTHDLPLSPYPLSQGVLKPPGPHPAKPVDDAEVIERSWTTPELFAEIYDGHVVEIHKYVARRLGQDAADDLTAETFLIAFQQRERFDLNCRSARPWLYGIVTNLCGGTGGRSSPSTVRSHGPAKPRRPTPTRNVWRPG